MLKSILSLIDMAGSEGRSRGQGLRGSTASYAAAQLLPCCPPANKDIPVILRPPHDQQVMRPVACGRSQAALNPSDT
jgi:hypothetical protein